jgi:predicted dehydrogenase
MVHHGAKPARVGIVGAGKIAADVHLPLLMAMPDVDVAWIADRSAGRAMAVARAFGIAARPFAGDLPDLSGVDAVLLAIPLPPRPAYFDALESMPCLVLAEKPLAMDAAAHHALAIRFEPWRLAVGYQRRGFGSSQLLRDAVAGGLFGALMSISVAEGSRVTRAGDHGAYQDLPVSNGGGITLNLGCHSLDLAQWIVGATDFAIVDRSLVWDVETDRRARAIIDLSGPSGQVRLDWTVSWLDEQPNRMRFLFERATLEAPVVASRQLDVETPDRRRLGSFIAPGGAETVEQAFCLEWQEALAGWRGRQASLHAAGTSLLTARLMDALLAR